MELTVNNLIYSYDGEKNAVDGVSFNLRSGEYVALIGHNGSGKSTVARLLVGLLEKKAGTIQVDGKDVSEDPSVLREQIGIVFQNPDNQFIGSTVADDIAFGLENKCIPQSEMQPMIDHYSTAVGMHDFLDHEPTKLSGGQKQRVAIAGVLAMKPEMLIMDESTSMLDPKGRADINELVRNIHDDHQTTILSITHDIEEAVHADRILVMYQGKIVMQGKPEEVLVQTDKLRSLALEAPFSVRLAQALNHHGRSVRESLSVEEVVDQL